ncbi:hypothetical protein B484DRAFT_444456 [Ochromonadaceae sp. CCMP2298]|nr:hypothetical protein B484DRAFT_444456 [Ochromonadaceae sp. CCMP2298]
MASRRDACAAEIGDSTPNPCPAPVPAPPAPSPPVPAHAPAPPTAPAPEWVLAGVEATPAATEGGNTGRVGAGASACAVSLGATLATLPALKGPDKSPAPAPMPTPAPTPTPIPAAPAPRPLLAEGSWPRATEGGAQGACGRENASRTGAVETEAVTAAYVEAVAGGPSTVSGLKAPVPSAPAPAIIAKPPGVAEAPSANAGAGAGAGASLLWGTVGPSPSLLFLDSVR